jgi:nitroimidazol reductase NimA-like FMN-containing flavoprotein (pyridoxamine 5'-phosphate oxidase superfamily)
MKIFHGTPEVGRALTEHEIIEFLTISKKNLQLGTIDEKNEPNIHPVWFLYENKKIYISTETKSKKVKNIKKNNTVYFSIDDVGIEFKGVRGKGTVIILDNIESAVKITEKIVMKYTGTIEGSLGKEVIDETRQGVGVVLEITPKFYSTWSFKA